jgi:hypothetical protein
MRLRASVIAIAVLSPLAAFAQEPPPAVPAGAPPADANAAPPPAAPVEATPVAVAAAPSKGWKDLVTLEGLVDTYYMWNFMNGGSLNGVGAGTRAFDVNTNTFTLNYAKVGVGVSSDNVGLRLDLGYGATGFLTNALSPGVTPLALGAGGAFIVQQAYATVSPIPGLTIDAGKFVTTAGAEVIEANKNWLYSRSYLFNFIPVLHTGIRIGYKINDMVSVQGSVVNNWNGLGFETDLNAAKTFGLNAAITLPSGVGIIPTLYIGKEPGSTDVRILGDLVATYSMGPLGLNLNFDYINDKPLGIGNFVGVSAMAHYIVNEHLSLNGRFEFFTAKLGNGAAVTDATPTTTNEELTVGAGIPMGGRFEFRPEVRADFSNQIIINGKKNQVTATGAFLAWF